MRFIGRVVGLLCLAALLGPAPAWGGVTIHEIMYHPSSENRAEEYVELFNPDLTPVFVGGWQFTKGISLVLPPVILAPGDYLVVAADVAAFRAKYPGVTNVVGGWTGSLSDSGETIELADALGRVMDRVQYADEGDWAQRRRGPLDRGSRGWLWHADHDGLGRSLELVQPSLPNDFGQNWAASIVPQGTPGGPNSVSQTNIPPLILAVEHQPAVPRSTDPVRVSARLIDENPAQLSVSLHYRDHSALSPPPFSVLTMWDDGFHQDSFPADGIYAAVLPPQPAGRVIEFYVSATDQTGQERTWPAQALDEDGVPVQGANALFQVDDSLYSGPQPILRLVLTETERLELENIDRYSNAEMNGSLLSADGVESAIRYNVGVRIRGASTRPAPIPNFRVNIPTDRLWQGVPSINLNVWYAHAQVIGSVLSLKAGLTAAYARAAQVRLNGVNLAKPGTPTPQEGSGFGSYALVEVVGPDWADNHFPNDAQGNVYFARRPNTDLSYLGTNGQSYANMGYSKESNRGQNDWSDLVRLTDVLNNTPEPGYAPAVRQVLDPRQWVRYFALNSLLGNNESSLATGVGDDYDLYRGQVDPRFLLIPHDWDTILDFSAAAPINTDIFRATALPVLDRFLKHPEFAPLYFEELLRLAETISPAASLAPLLDQFLGSYVSPDTLTNMLKYAAARADHVRQQIPQRLTATNSLPLLDRFPVTTNAQITLFGQAHAARTRSVWVDNTPASWIAWQGRWTHANANLRPGLNRLRVQARDEHGQTFEETTLDVYYDDGDETFIAGGNLAQSSRWTAEAGPYFVDTPLFVLYGMTLTIDPGATVFFGDVSSFFVRGQLLVNGTAERPVRFARKPGRAGSWTGIRIYDSTNQNRICHAVLEDVTSSPPVDVRNSEALLEGLYFNVRHTCLGFANASLVVRNCYFPKTDGYETVVGLGIKPGGQLVFEGNYFGGTAGYNDLIEYTGGIRPGPIIQVLNNLFEFGSDDAVDVDETDAHIEGNIFRHFHRDAPRESPASGIATDAGSQIVAARNIFYDCDNGVLLKRGAYLVAMNNVFVGATESAITFGDTNHAILPGRGAYLDGNIFWANAKTFDHHDEPGYSVPDLTAQHCLIQDTNWPGLGNLSTDPMFINPTNDFDLRPGSPALGTGPNGLDMGAHVPLGVSLSGEPPSPTPAQSATLTVSGPGYVNPGISNLTNFYRYRLNDEPWSSPLPIDAPIVLTNLTNGAYTVSAIGRNSAGVWQDTNSPTRSRTWIVQIPLAGLRINELLADNRSTSNHFGTWPDLIELYNGGSHPVDLTGMQLSDDPARPARFVFPPGTVLPSGGYLVVLADNPNGTPGLHTGFGLSRTGETLSLRTPAAQGGALIDSVSFNLQIPDASIGRLPDGRWGLTHPTLGGPNQPAPVAAPDSLRITEWLAAGPGDDFVEIYNPLPLPVALDGLHWTDNSIHWPDRHLIPELCFVGPESFLAFLADGNTDRGADHLNFRLNYEVGEIALLDSSGHVIDHVVYGPQQFNVSQGRLTPQSNAILSFPLPTPGAPNILNQPPAVYLTSPVSGPVTLPGDLLLSAIAIDPDGQITRVEFLVNNILLASRAAPPYEFLWQDAPPALYSIVAKATDNLGAVTYSTPATIQPNLPEIALTSPTNGSLFFLGDTLSLQAALSHSALMVQTMTFLANTSWLGADPDPPYQWSWPPSLPGPYQLRAVANFASGSSVTSSAVQIRILNALPTNLTLVPAHATWTYLDTGTNLGTTWTGLTFDDSPWPSGPAQLGYGEGDETTVVGFGPEVTNKFITTYFRHAFELTNPAHWTGLELRLLRDDGAVVYLNGEEQLRSNMPDGPIGYLTQAVRDAVPENVFEPFVLSAAGLRVGSNVLAVEVHQVHAQTGDLSFALELNGTERMVEPWLLEQPRDVTVPAGGTAVLSVSALGQPLQFQWCRETGLTLPQATNASLFLEQISPDQAGAYYVVLSNPLGVVTSATARVSVLAVDTDQDGMPDYWEQRYGLNPAWNGDAQLDADNDWIVNLEEFRRQTNPLIMDLVLQLEPVRTNALTVAISIRFNALADLGYVVETSGTLPAVSWETVTNLPPQPALRLERIHLPILGTQQFFRVRTEP